MLPVQLSSFPLKDDALDNPDFNKEFLENYLGSCGFNAFIIENDKVDTDEVHKYVLKVSGLSFPTLQGFIYDGVKHAPIQYEIFSNIRKSILEAISIIGYHKYFKVDDKNMFNCSVTLAMVDFSQDNKSKPRHVIKKNFYNCELAYNNVIEKAYWARDELKYSPYFRFIFSVPFNEGVMKRNRIATDTLNTIIEKVCEEAYLSGFSSVTDREVEVYGANGEGYMNNSPFIRIDMELDDEELEEKIIDLRTALSFLAVQYMTLNGVDTAHELIEFLYTDLHEDEFKDYTMEDLNYHVKQMILEDRLKLGMNDDGTERTFLDEMVRLGPIVRHAVSILTVKLLHENQCKVVKSFTEENYPDGVFACALDWMDDYPCDEYFIAMNELVPTNKKEDNYYIVERPPVAFYPVDKGNVIIN